LAIRKKTPILGAAPGDVRTTKSYKFELYPTKDQRDKLFTFLWATRCMYNDALEWLFTDKMLFDMGDIDVWLEHRVLALLSDTEKKQAILTLELEELQKRPGTQCKQNKILDSLEKMRGKHDTFVLGLAKMRTEYEKKIWPRLSREDMTVLAGAIRRLNKSHPAYDASLGIPATTFNSTVAKRLSQAQKSIYTSDRLSKKDGNFLVSRRRESTKTHIVTYTDPESVQKVENFPNFRSRTSSFILEAQKPSAFINGKLGNLKITPALTVQFCAYVDILTGSAKEITQAISARRVIGMSVGQQITVAVDGTGRWWTSITIDTNHSPVLYPVDINKTMALDFRPAAITTSTGFRMMRSLDALRSVTSYPNCAALAKKYEKNQNAIVMKQREVSRKYELHKRASQTFKTTHVCPICGAVASDEAVADLNTFKCSCGFSVRMKSKNHRKAKFELSMLHARSAGILTNLRRHIVHSWVASEATTFVIQDIPLNEGFKAKAKTKKDGEKDKDKKPRRWRGCAIRRRNINRFTHQLAAGTLRSMLVASAATMQKNVIVVSSDYDPLHTCSCGHVISTGATMCDDVVANAPTRLLYIPFDHPKLVLGAKSGTDALRRFGEALTQKEARKQAKLLRKAALTSGQGIAVD